MINNMYQLRTQIYQAQDKIVALRNSAYKRLVPKESITLLEYTLEALSSILYHVQSYFDFTNEQGNPKYSPQVIMAALPSVAKDYETQLSLDEMDEEKRLKLTCWARIYRSYSKKIKCIS